MRIIRLALCVLASAAGVFGQTALATITGTVSDSSGAVMAAVPVEVRNTETGQLFTAATSTTGNYTVSQLPVGDYDLVVTKPGFKTYNHKGFHLAAAQVVREDVVLTVGATSDVLTVTAETSLIDGSKPASWSYKRQGK